MAMDPEPDTLRMNESGSISPGMPSTLHTGAKKEETEERTPEADNSSIAVTSPTSEGVMSKAHFRPFMPPFVNCDQMLTLFMSAVTRITHINNGME